jgi:ectoine hydroxylase-related dioxygenase (phytanoyl-CoA dioxygenase family)
MAHIDSQTIDDFHTDGAAVLRGVFRNWVETLRKSVDFNMAEPSADGKIYVGDNGGGRFLSDYCNWQRIPEYRDFIFKSPAAEIAAELMQCETVQLFHEHVLVKEAQAGVPTPWHQDQPYYCVEGPKTVSLWIPLDEVPRERSLEFVAGSHRQGKLYRPQRFNGQPLNDNDGLDAIPNIDGHRGDYDIKGWALSPGDAVAFDYRTVHGAPANTSASAQRRAFSLRLVGDEARFVRRDGIVTSPPFTDIKLEDGAALEGPEFPVLYRQSDRFYR